MKRLQLLAVGFVCMSVAAINADSHAADTHDELLKRGTYIMTGIQGCGCHTPRNRDGSLNLDRYLSGAPSKPPKQGPPTNAGWTNSRWKKLYAKNITPDPETGIGKWTERDFITALRTGETPEGRILDPQMPWQHFQGITDRDLKSIWTYLRTVKPVKNKVPADIPR
jgi:hypothetical protein